MSHGWPANLLHTKSSFLEKSADNKTDPLAYRVLHTLLTIYHRWASMRIRDLVPWIKEWQLDEMLAGVEGQGARDAAYLMAMQLEIQK